MLHQKWEVEPWTGNDVPYAKERRRLEEAPLTQIEAILREGQHWAPNSTPRPMDWFRYGTAAYVATTKWQRDAQNELTKAAVLSVQITSPATPTFSRLRFLLLARGLPQPELKNIGLRLAQRDPHDYDVRYYLCSSLVPDRIPANKPLALRLCAQMQQLAPKRASAYSAQGSVYFRCWLARRDKQNRQGALTAYKRYLQLAPVTDSFRPQAQRIIAQLEKA